MRWQGGNVDDVADVAVFDADADAEVSSWDLLRERLATNECLIAALKADFELKIKALSQTLIKIMLNAQTTGDWLEQLNRKNRNN